MLSKENEDALAREIAEYHTCEYPKFDGLKYVKLYDQHRRPLQGMAGFMIPDQRMSDLSVLHNLMTFVTALSNVTYTGTYYGWKNPFSGGIVIPAYYKYGRHYKMPHMKLREILTYNEDTMQAKNQRLEKLLDAENIDR